MKLVLCSLLSLFASIVCAAEFPVADIITHPGKDLDDSTRSWQGIPGIERAPKGRLWATWYSGDLGEGDIGNYALAATSGDEGRTWSKPLIIRAPAGTKIGDPIPWLDPKGRLWIIYNQLTAGAKDKGTPALRGTMAIRTDTPDSATGRPCCCSILLLRNTAPTVVVGPLASFTPWEKEAQIALPGVLDVKRVRGVNSRARQAFYRDAAPRDLLLLTYPTVVADLAELARRLARRRGCFTSWHHRGRWPSACLCCSCC